MNINEELAAIADMAEIIAERCGSDRIVDVMLVEIMDIVENLKMNLLC